MTDKLRIGINGFGRMGEARSASRLGHRGTQFVQINEIAGAPVCGAPA